MDFGVAMKRSWDPAPGELRRSFGTPHFMSPEQAAGEMDLDGRSDLYALGVLGWLMLTGALPFTGDSPAEVVAMHVTMTPPSLARLVPDAPSDLVRAIERCLRKEPGERWRHARELHDALVSRRSRPARLARALGGVVRRAWHGIGRVFDLERAPAPRAAW
jgi:serine/threonine-protein kinase